MKKLILAVFALAVVASYYIHDANLDSDTPATPVVASADGPT